MLKILVLNDESKISKFINTSLRGAGYEVTSVLNGKEVLDVITQREFDLIVADSIISDLNSGELTNIQQDLNYSTPIIIIKTMDDNKTLYKNSYVDIDGSVIKQIDDQELFHRVKFLLHRINEVCESILELSKHENESITEKNPTYIAQLIIKVVNVIEPDETKRERFVIKTTTILDYHNQELLMQMLLNIVSNSVKHSDDNSQILISNFQDKKYNYITVQDDGIGKYPDVTENVFNKFYQENTQTKTIENGIGLSIVKRILEFHDLVIKIESTLNNGTIFTVITKRSDIN